LFGVVPLSGALDDGTEFLERAGSDGGGFGGAFQTAGFFLGGLVQGEFDFEGTTGGDLPFFVTVDVGDDIVVFDHFGLVEGGRFWGEGWKEVRDENS